MYCLVLFLDAKPNKITSILWPQIMPLLKDYEMKELCTEKKYKEWICITICDILRGRLTGWANGTWT